jgi:hypothetical protein
MKKIKKQMAHITTKCSEFLKQKLNEAIAYDVDKINCLRLKMNGIRKKMDLEKDDNKRRRYAMEIKVCELKIMIEKIK